MKELKPGDRVRVFGFDYAGTFFDGVAGEVREIPPCQATIRVEMPGRIEFSSVHEGQCRKLIKKERRRISVKFQQSPYGLGVGACDITVLSGAFRDSEHIEFIEVRKAKQ